MPTTHLTADPGRTDLTITREFDAPREHVLRAFVDPVLYVRWLGPRRLTRRLEVFEPHTWGSYRFDRSDLDGSLHAFHGVYHEVSAPDTIISTFEYEGLPEGGHVVLDATSSDVLHGWRTRGTVRSALLSVEGRDGMRHIGHIGMEEGMREMCERLDELLRDLALDTQRSWHLCRQPSLRPEVGVTPSRTSRWVSD